jgi:acetyl-CoA carboxylase biotin carboxyl carrier protein
MNKNEIYELLDRFEKSKLTSLTLEQEGTKLILEQTFSSTMMNATETAYEIKNEENIKENIQEINIQEINIQEVKSPLVGTFYLAPSPGAAPYAKIGQKIKKGDVIGIIEAMKLMNEVIAPYAGVVGEILVEDDSLVQYNQTLFRIKETGHV